MFANIELKEKCFFVQQFYLCALLLCFVTPVHFMYKNMLLSLKYAKWVSCTIFLTAYIVSITMKLIYMLPLLHFQKLWGG